jgi:hypothetical protein
MRNGKYFPVLYNPLDVDPPFQKDPIMMPIYNEIEYKIGDVLYGQYQNETSEIIVEEDNTFNDYKSIRKGQTITIRFENNNCYFNPKTKNISSELLDNFFWIESFGNKVFRIEEISETRDLENNEDILFWEITFSYTGNEFQKSGQSPMNFIQFSAPGMGYAFPKIVKKEDEFYKNVYIDEDVLKHPGITHAKLEKLGFSLQGTFSLMACEITDFTEEIQVDNKNNISNMGSITQPEQILGTENYRVIL